MMKPVAITLGDVNGIGPEVALKAVFRSRFPAGSRFVFIGPAENLREQARALGLPDPLRSCRATCLDTGAVPFRPGQVRADAARAAAEAIRLAVEGCLAGDFAAMVTAPISKEGFHKAGIDFPGHTEMLAELTGTRRYGMMLIGGGLRVMLVTRHLPLAEVPAAVTRRAVGEAIELTAQALAWLGTENRRVAVCGLNPHAGDGGVLGDEEQRVIAPAVRAARRKGWAVEGPVPADTVFHRALRGGYGAVVAMYHDQGLAPLKMAGFDEGINLTLGLPIVRTSPDHGTAYDLAGKGVASARSMRNALRLAIKLAARPAPWK